MLGWHISIYRQKGGGASPASFESSQGAKLAVWQAGFAGLNWITNLVKQNKVVALGGNGYPLRFTAKSVELKCQIVDGPPGAHSIWCYAVGDILSDKWEGQTTIDLEALNSCSPDEWLIIEAWDES